MFLCFCYFAVTRVDWSHWGFSHWMQKEPSAVFCLQARWMFMTSLTISRVEGTKTRQGSEDNLPGSFHMAFDDTKPLTSHRTWCPLVVHPEYVGSDCLSWEENSGKSRARWTYRRWDSEHLLSSSISSWWHLCAFLGKRHKQQWHRSTHSQVHLQEVWRATRWPYKQRRSKPYLHRRERHLRLCPWRTLSSTMLQVPNRSPAPLPWTPTFWAQLSACEELTAALPRNCLWKCLACDVTGMLEAEAPPLALPHPASPTQVCRLPPGHHPSFLRSNWFV